ncbi:hypothetical protein GCM10027168_00510 [Streptomyces capparidis]
MTTRSTVLLTPGALLVLIACLLTPAAATPVAPAAATAAPPGSAPGGVPAAPAAARHFRGLAFDTCTAPSLATLTAWRKASRYRAVGVYMGGRARACAQPRLTRSWVRAADRAGWRLLPLYLGSQAPCVYAKAKRRFPIDAKHPYRHGLREGQDAVRRARALGMAKGSALYLDIEHYDIRNAACSRAVLAFTRRWSRTVRSHGYLAGVYGNSTSAVRQLAEARRKKTTYLPDAVWFARWNNRAVLTDPVLRAAEWHPHRRAHQYRGNVRERHGGHTLVIDRNIVDAPVAVVSP